MPTICVLPPSRLDRSSTHAIKVKSLSDSNSKPASVNGSTIPPGRIDEPCPNCLASSMTVVYEVRRVPVQSSLLVSNAELAHRYPCGDIRLALCSDCGFISNLLFNSALQVYRPEYREAQHYSNEFNRFSKRLAGKWVNDFEIRNKDILEIGCAKDKFLKLLRELGGNTGIGIDITCNPSPSSGTAKDKIQLMREEYSSKYGEWTGDVLCCRHTLEHVFATAEFVEGLHQFIGDRDDTLLLFALPDVSRILRKLAFWDFNYEHCSYFTAGSLARLFRQNSFDVIDLLREYDDRYLVLAARPSSGPTMPRFEFENDVNQTLADVASFKRMCPERVHHWQARVRHLSVKGKKIVAWGSGSRCVSFCTTLGISEALSYAVDTDPLSSGKFLPGTGHRIVDPEFLHRDPPDVVIAMNSSYSDEIAAQLDGLGLEPQLLSL